MGDGLRRWVRAALALAWALALPAFAQGVRVTNAVVDGGFERGDGAWVASTSDRHPAVIADPVRARSGSGVAWLGGHHGGSDSVGQSVQIPETAARVTVSFWYRVQTENPDTAGQDHLAVLVSDGSGAQTIASISSRGASGQWLPSAPVDITSWRGRAFGLTFFADLDDTAITSFYIDDVEIAVEDPGLGGNYTGLWWDRAEPGWGVSFNHQGGTLFATLFTHDDTGAPRWLVMPRGLRQRDLSYAGTLYRTKGVALGGFRATPPEPEDVQATGSLTVSFAGDGTALLAFTTDGSSVRRTLTRQVFGARAAVCEPTSAGRAALANVQDLWWNPAQPGWGLHIAHQGEVLFATLATYDESGRDLWLAMSRGARQADGSYRGELYRAAGAPLGPAPLPPQRPSDVTAVGAMQLRFADGTNGTLSYTVGTRTVTTPIVRQVFGSPLPACEG